MIRWNCGKKGCQEKKVAAEVSLLRVERDDCGRVMVYASGEFADGLRREGIGGNFIGLVGEMDLYSRCVILVEDDQLKLFIEGEGG